MVKDSDVYIEMGAGKLHYTASGQGKKLLLAFHGYGNDAGKFMPLTPYLATNYTLLSFDLPHHGGSEWPEGVKVQKADFVALATGLMADYGVDKISLLGYSMGARVCLSLIEQMPDKIGYIVLIAPDGIVFSTMYYFLTRNFIGKRLFGHFLSHTKFYLPFVDWLKKVKILDPSLHKFASYYLQSEKERDFLLKVWPAMALITVDSASLKKIIDHHHLKVDIFMGAYDRIIPVANAKKFIKNSKNIKLHIMDTGHNVINGNTAKQIVAPFLN